MHKRWQQGMVLFGLCAGIAAARQNQTESDSLYYYWYSPQEVVARLHAGTLAKAPRVLVNGRCWIYTAKTKDDQAVGEQDELIFIGRTTASQERIGACQE